jgi:ornithine carbamoyltransferase
MNHFISIAETPTEELRHVLDVSYRLKKQLKTTGRNDPILTGKTLAMIFEKPSLRTRVSFAVAIEQLGGNGLLLRDEEVGLDKREATEDVARVISSMCDGIMARTFEHEKVVKLAKYSKVPVINALTDYSHPCQAMADLMTIEEHFGNLAGRTVAYIGDGNNVTRSLAVACGKFGMKFIIAAPLGYELDAGSVERIKAQVPGIDYKTVREPAEAAATADVLYTDTWVSMGQEAEKAQRVADFEGYQINANLLSKAPPHCIIMHCLPAYRGLEISADMIDHPRSLIFAEAENRLHFQKGLIAVLMGKL